MRRLLTLLLLVGFTSSAPAAGRIGVIMIHGKQGMPGQFESYEAPLAELGFLTQRPEMCWSRQRIYDRTYLDCLRDIDRAADRLKANGAAAIVIVGMSLGGNAALAYGARRPGLAGIVVLAPAHAPERLTRRQDIAASIEQARSLVAAGRGHEKAAFAEVNTGYEFIATTTPNIYLSFHGSDSPAVMPSNAARLTAPLLYIAGAQDRTQLGPGYIFDKAPKHALNRYVVVHSDHRGTPAAGRNAVLEWLKELAKR